MFFTLWFYNVKCNRWHAHIFEDGRQYAKRGEQFCAAIDIYHSAGMDTKQHAHTPRLGYIESIQGSAE